MRPGFVRLRSSRPRRAHAALLGALSLGALGCASGGAAPGPSAAPANIPIQTSFDAGDFANQPTSVVESTVSASPDRVWSALPDVYATLGVEATTVDARARVIGNTQWRPRAIHGSRLSTFFQCGNGITGPNADSYEVTTRLLVQLESAGSDSTLVRVITDASARPRAAAGTPIQCASFGTLESRVRRLLDERLASPNAFAIGEGGIQAGGGGAGASTTRLYGYRLPQVGDVIRVGCASAPSASIGTRAGTFLGAGGGVLRLDGAGDASLAVPAAATRSVEIRERRSRARLAAVAGVVLGIAGGAWYGGNQYDPDAKTHFPRSGLRLIGGVVGGIGGALVGAATGALIRHDTWVEVPPSWAVQVAGLGDGSAPPCFAGTAP